MAGYRHILLATDFSESGAYVARKAKSLADGYQARLSLIHVLDNIPMPDTNYGTVIPLNEESGYDLLENEKAKLIKLSNHLQISPTDRWLIWGVPKEEIALLAERQSVDLIVVGSHGRHGLALLLGSTANGVLHGSKCDVMAVRLPDV